MLTGTRSLLIWRTPDGSLVADPAIMAYLGQWLTDAEIWQLFKSLGWHRLYRLERIVYEALP